jgi:alkylation response protein AidB-like acyl-CoA dehydrogenase
MTHTMTMIDVVTIIVAAAGGGGGTWVTQSTVAWFKSRGERATHRDNIEVTREQHQDSFVIELLATAREEVAAARVEAVEMRSLQLRLLHFEEALDHIQALLDATNAGDPVARLAAERRAHQFLIRMKRLADARGAIGNEIQVQESKSHLAEKGIIDGGPQ